MIMTTSTSTAFLKTVAASGRRRLHVSTRATPSDSRNRITLRDGRGNTVGHRPGFVVSDAVPQEALDAIKDAHDEYLDYIQNAWRGSH
jgi:hypothetical protein